MKRALIIGSGGQDGRLLFERLAGEACVLLGVERNKVRTSSAALQDTVDILEPSSVKRAIAGFAPDTIFYLAGYHHSAEDKLPADDVELFVLSHDAHVLGLLNVLEAVYRLAPNARVFYAASSHCFGEPSTKIQNESTPLNPRGIYGITKTAGVHLCRLYRDSHGVQASVGFLYNHESPLRSQRFLSMKIAAAAVRISRGQRDKLVLGDLSARVDWGYAVDTIDAMIRIVELAAADDFVIATGKSHSVEDFISIAFSRLKLDWRQHVTIDPSVIVKRETAVELIGDSGKLRGKTNWVPSVSFQQLVEMLVDAELSR